MWKVKQVVFCGKGVSLDDWADRDWEPFAVCPYPTNKDMTYLFLRRQTESEPTYFSFSERSLFTPRDLDKHCKDTRIQTLKEVGKWIQDNCQLMPMNDYFTAMSKLHRAAMEGRMP